MSSRRTTTTRKEAMGPGGKVRRQELTRAPPRARPRDARAREVSRTRLRLANPSRRRRRSRFADLAGSQARFGNDERQTDAPESGELEMTVAKKPSRTKKKKNKNKHGTRDGFRFQWFNGSMVHRLHRRRDEPFERAHFPAQARRLLVRIRAQRVDAPVHAGNERLDLVFQDRLERDAFAREPSHLLGELRILRFGAFEARLAKAEGRRAVAVAAETARVFQRPL